MADSTPAKDSYTAFIDSLSLSHVALKRGVRQLETFAPNIQASEVPSFSGYALAFLANLQSHHDQEEEIIFPAFSKKIPQVAERHAEHEKLHAIMDTYKAYVEAARDGKEEWSKDKFLAVLKPLKELVVPHVDAEEVILSPAALKAAGFSEDDVQTVNSALAAYGKQATNKSVDLAFLVSHLTPEERGRFWAKAPYLVREWIFWSYTLVNYSWWTYASTAAL